MLPTDKIANAFTAIVEEAEKLMKNNSNKEQQAGLKTIISIARHQSDIRNLVHGECTGHSRPR